MKKIIIAFLIITMLCTTLASASLFDFLTGKADAVPGENQGFLNRLFTKRNTDVLDDTTLGEEPFGLDDGVPMEAIFSSGIEYIECTGDPAIDTPAIQNAIDNSQGYILLSEGTCKIDTSLNVLGKRGLRLEGQGDEATYLKWVGPSDEPMFNLQAARKVSFSYFSIVVDQGYSLLSAFDLYNDCTHTDCPQSWIISNNNKFLHLTIAGSAGTLENGVRILLSPDYADYNTCLAGQPGGDCNNEAHFFSDVSVSGYTNTGFLIEGINSKGNVFYGCHCGAGKSGQDMLYNGNSCVSTICTKGDDCHLSGSFYWYGGFAMGNKDADFVLGYHNDPILISGVYSEKSRMLLRVENDNGYWTPYPITVDSARFATHYVHYWDSVPELANPEGIFIDMNYRGPLTIRGSSFGSIPGTSQTNLAICWRIPYPDNNHNGVSGGFIFEGNSIVTTRDNPFNPEEDCYYPTTLQSNIIGPNEYNRHEYMPEYITSITTDNTGAISVRRLGSSYEFFEISGTDTLYTLEDGYVGQTVYLKGTDGTPICHSSVLCPTGNINLAGNKNFNLNEGNTLTLTLFPDGIWYEVARSSDQAYIPYEYMEKLLPDGNQGYLLET